MFNLLLVLAFIGIIIISAGFAGVTFLQGVQSSLDAEITTQRLMDVATEVQSHMRLLDPTAQGSYTLALPAGTTGSTPYAYNQVPSFITSNARSASGVPFEYCPYAQSNDSLGDNEGSITTSQGSYPAGTYNWSSESSSQFYGGNDTASQTYMTDNNGNSNLPTGLPPVSSNTPFGLLVAAAPNQFYPPDCSSVSTDISNAYPKVSGGIAVVINNNSLNKMKVAGSMTDFHFYVSTAPSGDGSGRDTNDYMTLQDALTIIQNLKPASAMIYVDGTGGATYNITTSPSSSGSCSSACAGGTFSWGKRIYLEGITVGGNNPTVNTSSNIWIDEYSLLSIGNMTFNVNGGTGTMTVNGTLEMSENSPILNAGTVDIYGGNIKGYSNVTNGYSSSMTINASYIIVDGGGTITSSGTMKFTNLADRGFQVINGHVYGGTTMEFDPGSSGIVPIDVKAGGDLVAGTGTMTINNTGSTAAGGIVIDPGGRFFGAANSPYHGNGSSYVVVKNTSNYGFYVHGEMDLIAQNTGSTVPTAIVAYRNLPSGGLTDGIVLASGGRFMLENSTTTATTIGESASHPTYGIYDAGGSQFFTMASGSASSFATNNIYATASGGACWTGANGTYLFAYSGAGTSSGSTTAANGSTFPANWYRMYNNSNVSTIQCNLI